MAGAAGAAPAGPGDAPDPNARSIRAGRDPRGRGRGPGRGDSGAGPPRPQAHGRRRRGLPRLRRRRDRRRRSRARGAPAPRRGGRGRRRRASRRSRPRPSTRPWSTWRLPRRRPATTRSRPSSGRGRPCRPPRARSCRRRPSPCASTSRRPDPPAPGRHGPRPRPAPVRERAPGAAQPGASDRRVRRRPAGSSTSAARSPRRARAGPQRRRRAARGPARVRRAARAGGPGAGQRRPAPRRRRQGAAARGVPRSPASGPPVPTTPRRPPACGSTRSTTSTTRSARRSGSWMPAPPSSGPRCPSSTGSPPRPTPRGSPARTRSPAVARPARTSRRARRRTPGARAMVPPVAEDPHPFEHVWPSEPDLPDSDRPGSPAELLSGLPPIVRVLRGDREARQRLVAALAAGDPDGDREWQLRVSRLVDAINARAIEDGYLDLPEDDSFWRLFERREARDIVGALSALGYRYDGMGGFADGRVPPARDLSLAVGYAGLDRMRIRTWPRDSEISQLYERAVVAADEWLADQAGDLSLGRMVDALGNRAADLADLWNAWGRVRPALLGLASAPALAVLGLGRGVVRGAVVGFLVVLDHDDPERLRRLDPERLALLLRPLADPRLEAFRGGAAGSGGRAARRACGRASRTRRPTPSRGSTRTGRAAGPRGARARRGRATGTPSRCAPPGRRRRPPRGPPPGDPCGSRRRRRRTPSPGPPPARRPAGTSGSRGPAARAARGRWRAPRRAGGGT